MYQSATDKLYAEPTITVHNVKFPATDNFTYLGSTLSRSVNIDAELKVTPGLLKLLPLVAFVTRYGKRRYHTGHQAQSRPFMANFNLVNGHVDVVLPRSVSRTLRKLLSNALILIWPPGLCKLSNKTLGAQLRAATHEANRIQQAKLKRQQRKSRTASIWLLSGIYVQCASRSLLAKVDLKSLMRTHASVTFWCCYGHHLSRWTNYIM